MDSLGRGITTSLWSYHPPCPFFLSPSICGNFLQGNASGVKLCFKSITFDSRYRDSTLLFKIGNILVFWISLIDIQRCLILIKPWIDLVVLTNSPVLIWDSYQLLTDLLIRISIIDCNVYPRIDNVTFSLIKPSFIRRRDGILSVRITLWRKEWNQRLRLETLLNCVRATRGMIVNAYQQRTLTKRTH